MEKNWIPSENIVKSSNIFQMMDRIGVDSYKDFWKWSVQNKLDFWEETIAALGIVLDKKYSSIVDVSQGVENAKWLHGAKMNIVDSCFQNIDSASVIFYQKEGGEIQSISQKELEILVNKAANGLVLQGLLVGDIIAIDMPMTLEAVVIYLAAIKAGVIVATIADSFTVNEIKIRLKITKPTIVFTQDVFVRNGKVHSLYGKVLEAAASKVVVVKTGFEKVELRDQDLFWDDFLSEDINFESIKQDPEETITILFSSGTTGVPKAIPWNHTTPIKSASDGYYHHNIQKDNVVCWPTSLGWMMGPWLVFSALINKASIALYYGTPIQKEFGDFVEKTKVTMLGIVPSIVKSWKNSGVMEAFNWSTIQCFSSTGEVSNPTEMSYLMQLANHKPIIEYCGGTEIGGGYITGTVIQENNPSQFSTQALGGEFVLLDEKVNESSKGEVFLIPPILGLSTKLLNKNHHDTYYKDVPLYKNLQLRRHGDQMQVLENGYFKARGRIDDAMNLGGVKVSAVQIEAVINTLEFVKESAAIAISPEEGGASFLIVYYVCERNIDEKEALKKVQNSVKTKLNPLFKVIDLLKIDNLPRTASNKIKRKELRENYNNSKR